MNGDNFGLLIPIIGVCIPIVAIVSVFVFVTFAVRYGSQRREREAYYKRSPCGGSPNPRARAPRRLSTCSRKRSG